MKYLVSWEKLNEKFNIDDNLVREYFEDYFLDILEDSSIDKIDNRFRVVHYNEKKGNKFIRHNGVPNIGDYIEYEWSIKLIGDFGLEEFKSIIDSINKKDIIVTHRHFLKKQSYTNGIERSMVEIEVRFICNKQIILPEKIENFKKYLEEIGYEQMSGSKKVSNINYDKKINYKIKTNLPESFIERIPNNTNEELKQDYVKELNKEIEPLISKEIEPISDFLGSKFLPYITNTRIDASPLKSTRLYTTIREDNIKSFIWLSIRTSIKQNEVFITHFRIRIANEELT